MNANSAYAELISLDWNAPDVTFPPVRRPTNASGETSTSFGDVPTPSIPATSDSGSEEVVIERSQVDEIFDSGLRESVPPETTQDMLSSSASPYSPRSPVWSPNFPPTDTDSSEPTNVPSLTLAGSAQSATSTFTPQPLAWAPNYGPVNTTSEPAATPLTLIGAPTTSPRPPRPAFGPRSPVWSSNFTTTDTGPSEPINIPSSTPIPSPSTQRLWQYPGISYTRETTITDQPSPYEHQFNQHWAERERRIRERETTASPSDRIVHLPQNPRGANRGPDLPTFLAAPRQYAQHPSHLRPRPLEVIACPSSLRMPTREPILERPDVPGRNAALTTISNILFNFDIHPEEAADLLEDACATAQSVGVSTHELLAQTVCFGNEDLGVTPLYLEASRWDLGGETDLVAWLIEHSPTDVVERDLKRACLSRCSGMGEQLAWSTLKLFVPERPDQAVFAYDAVVENVGFVPDGARLIQAKEEIVEDDEDEGSLYDDVSFIDQADIETLKSSEDEPVAEPAPVAVEPPLGRIHRARLDVPLFKEALTFEEEHVSPAYTALPPWNQIPSKLLGELPRGVDHSRYAIPHMPMKNRVLTAEWLFEGRLWALAMGEEKLVLTLRQASDEVSKKPIKVKAMIRVFPVDVQWDGFEELTTLGSDQLLPTHEPTDVLLIPPSYTCEFDETELVPGPPTLKGKSSLSRDGIHMSSLSLLEMVGLSGAMKVEVTIKTTEVPEIPVPQPSTSGKEKASDDEQDKGEWQLVD